MHNIPKVGLNEVRCLEGPVMAGFELLQFKVIGKGGHSS